ncbi:hypothetical protein HYPSUDRAFT_32786 [Hypholoma sublateritium FD-334 SS-4]|uniref:Major facilitator superfamily (MFS) profile domain-containing protein n=1 Tax=Hypholoma sublateritium (strain FD-334 SS-4) TaxID=945553 RepID=A0A0D2QCL5_HYPSF|nr:hypothetical protein HYPSUDRAFT_32786 [Hypholoma sublateritium FD-334 SS-4]
MSPPGSLSAQKAPVGLKWRSSVWMITFVIGLGIAVDLTVYSIIIPVMPFQLERLGYTDVSSLTGWLLFSFSAGLVLSTIPIALLSERYNSRQQPLVLGLVILTGSQIMLMEAPNYPVMCIARILQGVGSSMVWVVGLALLCDTAPPSTVALHIGFAMSGLSVGLVIGPAVGGALYDRFGYRGPFVFGIGATVLDLIGRLVIIERKDAIRWGIDPAAIKEDANANANATPAGNANEGVAEVAPTEKSDANVPTKEEVSQSHTVSSQVTSSSPDPEAAQPTRKRHLTLVDVMVLFGKSPRTLVACFLIFVYGLVYSSQEPSIPVHLQHVWGLDSKTVGLIFIGTAVPALFSSPLSGYLTDKYGAEWTTVFGILLAIPWWVVIIIQTRLALFISAFAIQAFFTSSVLSPLSAELADVSRQMDGVGYGHVYGALNFVFGIGSSLGPVIGGQLYDHLARGWMALCLFSTGMLVVSAILAGLFTGNAPLLWRFKYSSAPVSSDS